MKGAVEVVQKKITEAEWRTINETSEQMAAEGYRVLALAGGAVKEVNTDKLPPLQLLGLIGMIDPLRGEAKDAVRECRKAGIEVVMVTGDHPSTALAIAKELGIATKREEVITGAEIVRNGRFTHTGTGRKNAATKKYLQGWRPSKTTYC